MYASHYRFFSCARPLTALIIVILFATSSFATADRGQSLAKLNGDTCGGPAPPVTANPLVLVPIGPIPHTAVSFQLRRIDLLPGAVIPRFTDAGPSVLVVDSGAVVIRIEGEASITRYFTVETSQWNTTTLVSGHTSLEYRDSLAVPANVAISVVNEESVSATLLHVRILAVLDGLRTHPPAVDAARVEQVELASGVFGNIPDDPAMLALIRVVYAVGATDAEATTNAGPRLVAVERGAIGYFVAGGNAFATFTEGETVHVPNTRELVLEAGDSAAEERCATSRIRNLANERTWLLLASLVPLSTTDQPPACSATAQPVYSPSS